MTAAPKPDRMKVLMDTYLAELQEMPDEEVLEGQDPAAVQAEGLGLLDAAREESGRRRFAALRQKHEADK